MILRLFEQARVTGSETAGYLCTMRAKQHVGFGQIGERFLFPSTACLLLTVLLAISLEAEVSAHKPGAEFTYLSMFLERNEDADRPSLDDLYKTYTVTKLGSKSSHSRRLHQVSSPSSSLFGNSGSGVAPVSPEITDDEEEMEKGGDPTLSIRATNLMKTASPTPLYKPFKRSSPKPSLEQFKTPLPSPSPEQIFRVTPTPSPRTKSGFASDQVKNKSKSAGKKKVPSPEPVAVQEGPDDYGEYSEPGSDLATRHGENIDRLVFMLTKLIKQYHIQTLIDVPCRAHAHWMHHVLKETMANQRLALNFQYVCVDTNHNVLTELRRRLIERGLSRNTRFVVRKFWKEPLPKGDLVFSFSGLDNMHKDHVRGFFEILGHSKGRHKLVVLGSHTGQLAKTGNTEKIARFTSFGYPINVREAPFGLHKPIRIIKVVSIEGNDKQMYVYFPEKMLSRR